MKIQIVAIGNKMPAWVQQGYQQYAARLTGEVKLELCEVAACKRGKNADINKILADEGKRMLEKIPPRVPIICLDVIGKQLDTPALAAKLQSWQAQGSDVALLIGGPEGLAPSVRERAMDGISLSKLTLPHPLVRVVLAEALYRAYSLSIGHPYHRE